jgi:hypothetical protein
MMIMSAGISFVIMMILSVTGISFVIILSAAGISFVIIILSAAGISFVMTMILFGLFRHETVPEQVLLQ